MIDIHSHILPGIDDGSKSIDESVEMVKEAREAGFDTIISTSHYMEDYYEADVKTRRKLINQLERKLAKENIGIEILEGSEIYISDNINNLIKGKKASRLCESQYVLFEFPLNAKPYNIFELIFEIQKGNFIPILAHPERYRFIQDDPNILLEMIDRGVLMQSNYRKLCRKIWKSCKRFSIKNVKSKYDTLFRI